MILIDQVNLLNQNLVKLHNQEIVLPLMGGIEATKKTYKFKSLLHPARDIATIINEADPGADRLPKHLRNWSLEVKEVKFVEGKWTRKQKIHIKKLLNMVIHVSYLIVGSNSMTLSNDRGDKFIVDYNIFLHLVHRLVLTHEDVCLVICCLVENGVNSKLRGSLKNEKLWSENLQHCLNVMKIWPHLQKIIWKEFFAESSRDINNLKITDNAPYLEIVGYPFIMESKITGTTEMWKMGWRRGSLFSETWIDILRLKDRIQEYFSY